MGPPVTDTDRSHHFSLPPTEDIPALNWFGLLAVLMLGVAQVQMRRS